MAKIGRNEPCPCGSGKKYKQCCLVSDEQTARAAVAASQAAQAGHRRPKAVCNHCEHELDDAAFAVIALIEQNRLDEAEQAAIALRDKHPTMYDGYDCLAMVHHAKGEIAEAIACYRQVIALSLESPELYDPGFADYYREIIDDFERSAANR